MRRFSQSLSLFIIVSFCVVFSGSYAAEYTVNPGESIQAAIDGAVYGDTISVAAGTYTENITLKNGVALIGIDPNSTIIDGNQNGSVVTFPRCDPNTLLSGFTLTNGQAGTGGGLFVDYFASPRIDKCIFSGNTATYGGGGIYTNPGSHPTVCHCIFSSNSSDDGGAISNSGFSEYSGPYPNIYNCLFIYNSARRGGGIYSIDRVSPVVTGCTFYGNAADSNGSGIYNDYFCDPTISNCIFWDNDVSSDSMIYNNLSTPEIRHCDISNSGGSGASWDPSLGIDSGGNIDIDPLFIDPNGIDGILGTIDDNLRLLPNSPCIDIGYNSAVPSGVTTDLDENTRIIDGNCDDTATVDMGAYEFGWLRIGDFAGGCDVNLNDFTLFAVAWMTSDGDTNYNDLCDISVPADSIIDGKDFEMFVQNWLETTP